MRLGLPIILMPLLLASVPALAGAEPEAPPTKPAKAKKICRSQMPTGRRISESVCHTQAEWDEIDAADGAAARGVINQLTRQSGTPAASPNPMAGN